MTIPIGFDQASGSLVIVGNGVFPPRSLTAQWSSVMPGYIQINDLGGRGEQMVIWSDVTNLDQSFTPNGQGEAIAYLLAEFSKGPVTGSSEHNYALPASAGQPVFPLSPAPVDVNTVTLVVNGVAYYPPDTAVSSLAVAWQGPFPLDPTDVIRVAYF
jgi:hypothetical protein